MNVAECVRMVNEWKMFRVEFGAGNTMPGCGRPAAFGRAYQQSRYQLGIDEPDSPVCADCPTPVWCYPHVMSNGVRYPCPNGRK